MKRIDKDNIVLTQEEVATLREFIWDSLYDRWDRYTDTYVSSYKVNEGMRQMDPTMYAMMENLRL